MHLLRCRTQISTVNVYPQCVSFMNVQQNFPRVQNFHDPRDSDTALGGLDRRTGQEPHTRVMEMFLVLKHNFFFLTMIYFKKK